MLSLFPPLSQNFKFHTTRLFGKEYSDGLSHGIELQAAAETTWVWSNHSLAAVVQPSTLSFVEAGGSLPDPLPPLKLEHDSLIVIPEPQALEALSALFRANNKPAPQAFVYQKIEIQYNGQTNPTVWPLQLRSWHQDPNQRLSPEYEGLQINPLQQTVRLSVVSEVGHYLDPISVFKYFTYHKDRYADSYQLGEGFDYFCSQLPDNLIIEIRDEWNRPYEGEVQITLPKSSVLTVQSGLVHLEGKGLLAGSYHLHAADNDAGQRRFTLYEGQQSKPTCLFTLEIDKLCQHIYLQTINLPDWYVVEEFGHLYTSGNRVTVFADGRAYFERIHQLLTDDFKHIDYVFFTNWRLDYDFDLLPIPPHTPQHEYKDRASTIGNLLADTSRREKVFGILWQQQSPAKDFVYKEERFVNENAFALLNVGIAYDETVGVSWKRSIRVLQDTRGNFTLDIALSHHQKTFIMLHKQQGLIAFCGGLDLAFKRWDDAEHTRQSPNRLLPNPLTHTKSPEFDPDDRTPQHILENNNAPLQPWHDIQVELVGPAAKDVDTNFRDRWHDAPLDLIDDFNMQKLGYQIDLLNEQDQKLRTFVKATLPAGPGEQPEVGKSFVKIARTYNTRDIYTLMQNIIHCLRKARRLIYIEDQFLTSIHLAEELKQRLLAAEELVAIIVTGECPDQPGAITRRNRFLDALQYDLFRERVGVYHLCNKVDRTRWGEGSIYVHSKLVIIDDIWLSVGSGNLNNRSFTSDTELSALIIDEELTAGRRKLALELRKRLWQQHFRRSLSEAEMLDDRRAISLWETAVNDQGSQVIALRRDPESEESDLDVPIADAIVDPWRAGKKGVPDPDNANQSFTRK